MNLEIRKTTSIPEQLDVIVIGAGQAGLAAGYYLAQAKRRFILLDGGERIGQAWRQRWDSLKLFTPAEYDGLPGMAFPAPAGHVPSKDEVANYLEAYAAHFNLPVQLNTWVSKLSREGATYLVTAGSQQLAGKHVVVATSALQIPKLPAFAAGLDPAIQQLHSSQYRNPDQLLAGDVLVVGLGSSGAEIGLELAATRSTWLAGQPPVHLPARLLRRHVFSWLWPILTRARRDTWLGSRLTARMSQSSDPLIGISAADLARSGIRRVPRIVGMEDGKPVAEDGQILAVANVIWATGFRPDYQWISLPVFGNDDYPLHKRGVVEGEPGLYFVGLRYQYRPTSHLIGGVGPDAQYVAHCIDSR